MAECAAVDLVAKQSMFKRPQVRHELYYRNVSCKKHHVPIDVVQLQERYAGSLRSNVSQRLSTKTRRRTEDDDDDTYAHRENIASQITDKLMVNWVFALYVRLRHFVGSEWSEDENDRALLGMLSERTPFEGLYIPKQLAPLLFTLGPVYDMEADALFIPTWPQDLHLSDICNPSLLEAWWEDADVIQEEFRLQDWWYTPMGSLPSRMSPWWLVDFRHQRLILSPSCYVAMDIIMPHVANTYEGHARGWTFIGPVGMVSEDMKHDLLPSSTFCELSKDAATEERPVYIRVAPSVTLAKLLPSNKSDIAALPSSNKQRRKQERITARQAELRQGQPTIHEFFGEYASINQDGVLPRLLEAEAQSRVEAIPPRVVSETMQVLPLPVNVELICDRAVKAVQLGIEKAGDYDVAEVGAAVRRVFKYCLQSRVAAVQHCLSQQDGQVAAAIKEAPDVHQGIDKYWNACHTSPHAILPKPLALLANSICAFCTGRGPAMYRVLPCLPAQYEAVQSPSLRQWQLMDVVGAWLGAPQEAVDFCSNLEAHPLRDSAQVSKWWTVKVQSDRQSYQSIVQQLPGSHPAMDLLLVLLLVHPHGFRDLPEQLPRSFCGAPGGQQQQLPGGRTLLDWEAFGRSTLWRHGLCKDKSVWQLLCS